MLILSTNNPLSTIFNAMKQIRVLAPVNKHLSATISLDGSKSISNRLLIINALTPIGLDVQGLSTSDDTKTLVKILKNKPSFMDIGAAGTTMRFLTAYLATQKGIFTLTGSKRMTERPIGILVTALKALGANIKYLDKDGFPPLQIIGQRLKGGEVQIPANVSSQFLSALLLIAPTLENGLCLNLSTPVVSEPYLTMTLKTLEHYGIIVQKPHPQTINIAAQPFQPRPLRIEADWSAASYYYALAALAPTANITLKGLFPNSLQADSVLPTMMKQFGITTIFTNEGISIQKNTVTPPNVFRFDFNTCPDIAQTLVVICAALKIPAEMEGLSTLQLKETDRTAALQTELGKLGIVFQQKGSRWVLSFPDTPIIPPDIPVFDTYHDHRMAMSFAIWAMTSENGVIINNPDVVTKSYPQFWSDLKTSGVMSYEL